MNIAKFGQTFKLQECIEEGVHTLLFARYGINDWRILFIGDPFVNDDTLLSCTARVQFLVLCLRNTREKSFPVWKVQSPRILAPNELHIELVVISVGQLLECSGVC